MSRKKSLFIFVCVFVSSYSGSKIQTLNHLMGNKYMAIGLLIIRLILYSNIFSDARGFNFLDMYTATTIRSGSQHDQTNQQRPITSSLEVSSKLTCGYCRKGFKFQSLLDRHVRCHTGFKPFSCPKCSKSFTQKESLNYHMITHMNQ